MLQEGSPALLLGGAGQRLVLDGEDGEVLCTALYSAQRLVRRQIRAIIGEHAGKHFSRALW